MLSARCRRFCRALDQECGGQLLRWATIARVATRLGMDEREAILLAGECAEADYVRLDVKGPPYRLLPGSAILTEAGRQLLKKPVGLRPSKRSGKARAKARAGQSA
jgi:hypothetical protein